MATLIHFTLLTPLFIVLATIIALAIVISKYSNWKRNAQLINKIPGPPSTFLFGNILDFSSRSLSEITELFAFEYPKRYGRLYRFWSGLSPQIVVCNHRDLQVLLPKMNFINKSYDYYEECMTNWVGKQNLIFESGPKWHAQRKSLTPAFHFRMLEDHWSVVQQQTATLTEQLELEMEKSPGGFDVAPFFDRLTLDVISEAAMGYKLEAQAYKNQEYTRALQRVQEIVLNRLLQSLMPNLFFRWSATGKEFRRCLDIVHSLRETVLRERKAHFCVDTEQRPPRKNRLALLDLLLAAQTQDSDVTDDEISQQVDAFMFAGHDTTATALTWTCYLLGRHPEVQERLYQEIRDLCQTEAGQVTLNDISKLTYLDCCVKEALRMFPPVPFVGREVSENIVLGGYEIPAGKKHVLFVNIYALHHDPEVFPDPDTYKPERFLGGTELPNYAYIPFSAGPRNCIGQRFAMMEIKGALVELCQKFRWTSLQKPENLKPIAFLTLKPPNGVILQMEIRG